VDEQYFLLYITIAVLASFLATLYTVRWWIRKAYILGFTGRDMNKVGGVEVAEAGGVWVSLSVAFGILLYMALVKYTRGYGVFEEEYMALALLLFLSSFLGFLDDLLGWKKGLRAIYRVMLMAPLSIPLMVIKAGYTRMALPLIGVVDFGLAYPLVLVPLGILGAANAFNMVAGYNGLEALQGLVLMLFTAIFSWFIGQYSVFVASLIMMSSLLAFLRYNWYPAKVFPGNALTYGLGAYYASLVILGNFERFGILLFTLYFVELALFIRGLVHGVYKENYGIPKNDGSLEPPYEHVYSITHLAIKIQKAIRGRATEKGVVYTIVSIQVLVGIAALFLARLS